MAEFRITEEWVDRYLRDELDAEERDAFELELMDSPELSKALTAALGLQRAVELEDQYLLEGGAKDRQAGQKSTTWQTMAMAATLVLAVFSTTMYWRTSTEVSSLRTDLTTMRQPVDQVLAVAVEVMRSGSELEAPRAIAVPTHVALVLLDIEIPSEHVAEPVLNMRLSTQDGEEILAWQSSPLPSGIHNAAIRASLLPRGKAVLEVHKPHGEIIYRRLLEFR